MGTFSLSQKIQQLLDVSLSSLSDLTKEIGENDSIILTKKIQPYLATPAVLHVVLHRQVLLAWKAKLSTILHHLHNGY